MRKPSIKTLQTLPGVDRAKARELRAILEARREELEAMPAGEALICASWYSPTTRKLRLACLDAALGTYGAEAFWTRRGELVEYLNAGDTYTPTIVHFRGIYRVACWGDIAERHGAV